MADKVRLVSNTHLYLDCRALLNEILDVTPIVLRANIIDMGLLHLLESRYIVVIEKCGEDIVFELYKKIAKWI